VHQIFILSSKNAKNSQHLITKAGTYFFQSHILIERMTFSKIYFFFFLLHKCREILHSQPFSPT